MMEIQIWLFVVLLFVCVFVGAGIGFFVCRTYIKKTLAKNPPINEKMIRVMFQQMGRTASEKQVRQVMAQMNQAK